MGKVLLAELDPAVVRALAARQPLERFMPTTVTDVDALLVQLRLVARQGYALSNAEWQPGLRSLAAPVRSRDGRVVAAVCVIVVRNDLSLRALERDLLPELLDTAVAISAELGFHPRREPASA
jgi:IclR family pca regulon transcriptional regulator